MDKQRQAESQQEIPVQSLMHDGNFEEQQVHRELKGLAVVVTLAILALVLTAVAVWNLAREAGPRTTPVAPPPVIIIDKGTTGSSPHMKVRS